MESLELSNNVYEESKIRAERLVLARGHELRIRVLRPTIVLGHSHTRHGLNWYGMYGFARHAFIFRKLAEPKVGTLLSHSRTRLLADPLTPLNFAPVDIVARAVTIGLSDSPHTFFHLGNRHTLSVGPTRRR